MYKIKCNKISMTNPLQPQKFSLLNPNPLKWKAMFDVTLTLNVFESFLYNTMTEICITLTKVELSRILNVNSMQREINLIQWQKRSYFFEQRHTQD